MGEYNMDKVMEVLQGNLQQRIQYTEHVHVSYVLPVVVKGTKLYKNHSGKML